MAVWRQRVGNDRYAVYGASRSSWASQWSAPVEISPPPLEMGAGEVPISNTPQLAIDFRGNAVAVWMRHDADHRFYVEAAVKPVGGAWGEPRVISNGNDSVVVGNPRVAVSANGSVTIVWERAVKNCDPNTNPRGDAQARPCTLYRVRAVQGQLGEQPSWGNPSDISDSSDRPNEPRVAMGARGHTVVVWRHYELNTPILQSNDRSPSGNWRSSPVNLGRADSVPQVALDAAGNAVAVWERFDGEHHIAQANTKVVGGSWSAQVVGISSPQEDAEELRLAVGANGDAVAVWESQLNDSYTVKAATRPHGSTLDGPRRWSEPQEVAQDGAYSREPEVAVDSLGDAVVVFKRGSSNGSSVYLASRDFGEASWKEPLKLSTENGGNQRLELATSVFAPRIAISLTGNTFALWERNGRIYSRNSTAPVADTAQPPEVGPADGGSVPGPGPQSAADVKSPMPDQHSSSTTQRYLCNGYLINYFERCLHTGDTPATDEKNDRWIHIDEPPPVCAPQQLKPLHKNIARSALRHRKVSKRPLVISYRCPAGERQVRVTYRLLRLVRASKGKHGRKKYTSAGSFTGKTRVGLNTVRLPLRLVQRARRGTYRIELRILNGGVITAKRTETFKLR